MVLPAVAWALVSSSIIFLVSPRFPHYQITKIRIISFSLLNLLLRWVITCTIEAEMEIDNANFIGAQVHSTIVDMYHPDWNGQLRHIGDLRDKHNYHYRLLYQDVYIDWKDCEESGEQSDGEDLANIFKPNFKIEWNGNEGAGGAAKKDSSAEKTVDAKSSEKKVEKNKEANPTPFILPPRKTVLMYDNVISVQELGPRTYFAMIREFFTSPIGEIHMLSAGVAHVKTTLGPPPALPVTVTVLCDNRINALAFPAEIIERTCSPVDIFPGWLAMEEQRVKLQKEIMRRYNATGSVLSEWNLLTKDYKRHEVEGVEHWHDF